MSADNRTSNEHVHSYHMGECTPCLLQRVLELTKANAGLALMLANEDRISEPPSDARVRAILVDFAVAAWADPEPNVTLESFLAWMRSELQGFAPPEPKPATLSQRMREAGFKSCRAPSIPDEDETTGDRT